MPITIRKISPKQWLNKVVGKVVHWIDLNAVVIKDATVYKRRNLFGQKVTPLANWFFRTCRAPVMFWSELRAWQQWEVKCYHMLHPQFHAEVVGKDAIIIDQLPGTAMWDYLKRGKLTEAMLQAAAAEFRRAHSMYSEEHHGLWSHGDAAMGNLLFDEQSGRALFIDFEIVHQPELPAHTRQADDLHAFLMDLVSLAPNRTWLAMALAFLRAYGKADVIEDFRQRLVVPRGAAWLWWKIRVNFAQSAKLEHRMAKLAKAIDQGALSGTGDKFVMERRNQNCRPASHCHAMIPGMPKPSSRTRRMSDNASAPADEIPSSRPMPM